jgi:hypothetical protein
MTLVCKKKIVAKSKEVKTGWSSSPQEQTNLAESSKEDCGSKRAVLPVMVMKKVRAVVVEYRQWFPNC